MNRIYFVVLLFLSACGCPYEKYSDYGNESPSIDYVYDVYFGFSDSSIKPMKIVYDKSNVSISPNSKYTKLVVSKIKPFSFNIYTNKDTVFVMMKPVYRFDNNSDVTCKGYAADRKFILDSFIVNSGKYKFIRKSGFTPVLYYSHQYFNDTFNLY